MKVHYPGPEPQTFHPELGRLVRNEVFDLAAEQARPLIEGKLLKQGKPGSASEAEEKEK